MREITARQLRREALQSDSLPVTVVRDGVRMCVILSIEQYNEMAGQFKPQDVRQSGDTRFRQAGIVQNQVAREQASRPQAEPHWYDPQVHKPGDLVRVRRGAKVVTRTVPDLDGDGHQVPW